LKGEAVPGHIARPDAGAGRGPVLQHAGDDHALLGLDAKGLGQFSRQLVGLDANPATGDLAVLDNAVHHHAGGRHRNRKTDAHVAARARIDGGVDAQQIAVGVHQRAA
jgi:hypothetical protein